MTTEEAIALIRDYGARGLKLKLPNSTAEEAALLAAALDRVLQAAEDFTHLNAIATASRDAAPEHNE